MMNTTALDILAMFALAGANSGVAPSPHRELNTAQEQRQALYLRITQTQKTSSTPVRIIPAIATDPKD